MHHFGKIVFSCCLIIQPTLFCALRKAVSLHSSLPARIACNSRLPMSMHRIPARTYHTSPTEKAANALRGIGYGLVGSGVGTVLGNITGFVVILPIDHSVETAINNGMVPGGVLGFSIGGLGLAAKGGGPIGMAAYSSAVAGLALSGGYLISKPK